MKQMPITTFPKLCNVSWAVNAIVLLYNRIEILDIISYRVLIDLNSEYMALNNANYIWQSKHYTTLHIQNVCYLMAFDNRLIECQSILHVK